MCLLLADNLVVPLPNLCCDWLPNRAKNTERLHLSLDVLVASTLQKSEGGRCNVELGHLVLLAHVPVSAEVWVCWRTLKHNSGNTKDQWSVDDVGVAGDPTNVTSTEESVGIMNVEDILSGGCCSKQVASGCVHDTLWLAGGTRCVEKEEWVLRVHALWCDVCWPLLGLLVPPQVSALCPWNFSTCALVYETASDIRALLQCLVDDLLGANELASTLALVCGQNDL